MSTMNTEKSFLYNDFEDRLLSPAHKAWISEPYTEFKWKSVHLAKSYTLNIKKMCNWEYKTVQLVNNLKDCSYTLSVPLDKNELYMWEVTAFIEEDVEISLGARLFVGMFDAKNHPANKGLNFKFDKNGISEEVLHNYLSRAMSCYCLIERSIENFDEDLRMILYTGAKYINRALSAWDVDLQEIERHKICKELIAKAHSFDPDIVFEACVFEVTRIEYNQIEVPEFVFKAFGLPVEKRGFNYYDMLYEDGHYAECYGVKYGHPDLSRLETQMWFFYRAASLIDAGFEGIHLGSIPCMTDVDRYQNYAGLARICKNIREYAKTHSRRGFVLLNAHSHGLNDKDGNSLVDFNMWLTAGRAPEGSIPHPPKVAPQEIVLEKRIAPPWGPIYGDSAGCVTPSGWKTDSLPFLVELDNYPTSEPLDYPAAVGKQTYWGMDEMGWFRRQPAEYRRRWLKYANERVKELDKCGHFEMPGNRRCSVPAYLPAWFHGNLAEWGWDKHSCGDEVAVRNIWIEENRILNKGAK